MGLDAEAFQGGGGGGKAVKLALPPDEARVRAVAEIVRLLIAGVKEGSDVDLNALKMGASRK
eukprot:364772-Chlamydomonas_euryale.AAC.8